MKSRSLPVLLGLLVLGLFSTPAVTAAEVVKDGSFESTPPSEDNPNWEEGWIVLSPICDFDSCGNGGDTAGPRTGNNWVWFGGSLNAEQQFVSQAVTIPPGTATLTFYLWLGASDGVGGDAFRVVMDEEELFEVLETSTEYNDSYKLVTIDVSKFAGVGGPHNLSFEFTGVGGPPTNFSLDDISLQAGQAGGAGSVTLRGPKKVAKGKKAKLKASVQPCAGHAGETIELFRGRKKIASAMATTTCTAKFKVRIKKTSKFRAVSPAGTSNTIKVRVRKR